MLQIINHNDFLKNHVLTNLKIHPNGKFGLYTDNTLDYNENLYQKEIYLLDLEIMKSNVLHLNIKPDDYYFDQGYIIFKVVNVDKTEFYSYTTDLETLVKICEVPFVAIEVGFSDRIYFTAHIQNDEISYGVLSSEYAPYFQDGSGFVGQKLKALFTTDYSGKEIQVLTHLGMDVNLIDFDFTNNRIVFTAFERTVMIPVTSNVFLYDVVTDQLLVLTKSQYRIDGIKSWHSSAVLFTAVNLIERNRNDNQQVYKINLITDSIQQVNTFLDRSNEQPGIVTDAVFLKGSADQIFNDKYYHLRLDGHQQMVTIIDEDGIVEFIDTGLTMISNFCVLKNQIILLGLKGQQLSEIYSFSEGQLTQITNHNEWLNEFEISKPELVTVKKDGIEVKGWLFPPIKPELAAGSPGILMIHGGPKMVYSEVFSFDVQLLCAKGYYVFYANPMGSDGRGDAYADIRNSFAKLPYEQLMAFTDEVLRKYQLIDGENLGVTGGSYGGYMTNYIITRTNRFKAAVSERGFSSMVNMLTSSDIGYAFAVEYTTNKQNPWQHLNKYIELSPIMEVKEIETPTLFNHGLDDYRCHYTESLNMHSALCQLGIPSRLCLYEEENHGLVVHGKPKSKYKRFVENLMWYDKYLKRG